MNVSRKLTGTWLFLVLICIFLLFLSGTFSINTALSLSSLVIVLHFIVKLRYPVIIGYIFLTQWVSASTILLLAWKDGTSPDEFYLLRGIQGDMNLATTLSILSAFLFALGLIWGYGTYNPSRRSPTRSPVTLYLERFPITFVAITYAISIAAMAILTFVPSLSQAILPFAGLKWVGIFVLTTLLPRRRDLFPVWLGLVAVEIILSFTGFFSGFRTVFVYIIAGMFFTGFKLKPAHIVGAGAALIVVGTMAVYWTAIKVDFRNHINQGTSQQVVLVSPGDAVSKAFDLLGKVDGDNLATALEQLGSRIAYTQYFGAAILYVPNVHPHTSGVIWADAILGPFMPRILFPNKDILDDSMVVTQYTGINVPGRDQGAQIALGYPGESYVDFGAVGMFLPILAWAFFMGFCGKMLNHSQTLGHVFGSGLAINLFLAASEFRSPAKQVGAVVGVLIVYVVLSSLLKIFAAKALRPASQERSD